MVTRSYPIVFIKMQIIRDIRWHSMNNYDRLYENIDNKLTITQGD